MSGKPIVVLCDHGCLPSGSLDVPRLSDMLAKSDAVERLVVVQDACHAPLPALTGFQKRKVIFAGCPLLKEKGYYEAVARRLAIGASDFSAIDVKSDVLDLCDWAEDREASIAALLESAGRVLGSVEPTTDAVIASAERVLLIGDGASGLTAAIGLAAEGIPVEIIPIQENPLSPGCLGEIAREPGFIRGLRAKAAKIERIAYLDPGSISGPTPVDGGFLLRTDGGASREYGSIVFAPERQEEPAGSTGAYSLTQLYACIQGGKPPGGQVVFLLDQDSETEPEVFRDVLLAGISLVERACASVIVLFRNARVSLAGVQELYDRSREMGVLFVRCRDRVSIESAYGDFTLRGIEEATNSSFVIEKPKALVIPGRTSLSPQARQFARLLGLRFPADHYTQPDSLWLLPNGTNRTGVFAFGAGRENRAMDEIQREIPSLADRLRERTSARGLPIEERLPVVDRDKCAYCLTCVRACPFGAMTKDSQERVAMVLSSACRGCGVCAAECPAQAIEIRNLSAGQVRAGLGALVS